AQPLNLAAREAAMASRCQNEGKLALRCPSTNRLWANMQERRGFGRSQVLVSSGREIVRDVETSTHTSRRPRLVPWFYHRAPRSKGGASPTAARPHGRRLLDQAKFGRVSPRKRWGAPPSRRIPKHDAQNPNSASCQSRQIDQTRPLL